MGDCRGGRGPQLLTGLMLLGLGVLFLLGNLGYADLRSAARYWPTLLILIGLVKLVRARDVPAAIGSSLWVLAGTWLLLDALHIVTLSFWAALTTYWPVLLVGAGFSIAWRAIHDNQLAGQPVETSDAMRTTAILGATKRVVSTSDFKHAELTSVLGGLGLDLSRCSMQPGPDGSPPIAVIDVYALWGGIELRIPEGWVIDSQIAPVLGGFEDQTRPSSDPRAPRLVLRGTAVMGGLLIRS